MARTFRLSLMAVAVLSLAWLAGAPVLQAQSAVDGAVAGTVLDSTGAVLPNASIKVHNTATDADAVATSDASGYFRVSRLVPGDYTVAVSLSGFADYTAQHVMVEVGNLTEVTPKLGASGTSAVVNVSSDVPIINSESSDFSTEFTPTTLATLPINGRHWTSFALLSPGATVGNSAFGLVSFRGSSNLQNNFTIDGSDDNDSFDAVERGYTRVAYTTPEDAVLEFQVQTADAPAQYGRSAGGNVNAITKSGSNTFHGDLFEYYRDNDFGATNPYNQLAVTNSAGAVQTIYIKPKDKRHQYGGTFDGPIIKDKLFFLYSFDQQLRNFPILAVPTPQFLQPTNAAYNNCKVAAGGTTDSETCAIARGVTQTQINSALAYIGQQSGVAARKGNQIINFGKLDYILNSKNNVSLMYDRVRWDSPNGIQTNPVVRRGLTSLGNDFLKVDSVIGKVDTVITPATTNELRMNYARTFDTENGDKPFSNEPTTGGGGLPPSANISPNSGFVLGTPYYATRIAYPNEAEADIVDNVTYSHGNQTFQAGAEYRWAQDNINDIDYLHGQFNYSQLADFFTDFARTLGGTAGCDAARDTGVGTLPCYTTLTQNFGRGQFVYHTADFAGYVQDDVKLAKNLTLNLGLRYDYEQMPKAKIPNSVAPATAALPSDKNNLAPRIGFAYDVFSNAKTVVHGAFGLFYGRIQNGTIFKALSSTGSSNAQFQLSTASSVAGAPVYPNIVSTATPPAVSNIIAFAGNFQNPVADEATFSVQQQLGLQTVLTVAYLGAFGKQLPNFVDENIAPATTTKSYTFNGGPLAGDVWTVPVYTTRANAAYNALTVITSNMTTTYNALSVAVDHRMNHGVQIQASYTYSKALDYGMNQSSGADTNDQSDPFSVRPDYGRSINDIPQRFVGSIIVAPKFSVDNKFMSQAINGWTIAPVWTVQSGLPYSYVLSGGVSVPGGGTTYNGSGGTAASAAVGGSGEYVNFNAYPQYASQDVFNGATASRNMLREANVDDVDLRLSRSFSFLEKYKLTLSGEAFNVLNRENFSAYNTTAYTLSTTSATAPTGTGTYQATFGTPSGAGNTIYRERQIQFVGRFEF